MRTVASASAPTAFGSCPSKPLTWRSIQPGESQAAVGGTSWRSSLLTMPWSTVTRAGAPSSTERPSRTTVSPPELVNLPRSTLEARDRDALDDPAPQEQERDDRRQQRD